MLFWVEKFSEYIMHKNKDTKYKEYKIYIDRLKTRINNVNISENSGKGSDTSYSVNKGDELVLCLRSKINRVNKLIIAGKLSLCKY